MEVWKTTLDILILLCGALVIGLLFERLKQNAILGYLAAGILLGPPVLNLISSREAITGIADLGVTLLLFMIGLEFSWNKLKAMGMTYLWIGVLQITVTSAFVTLVCIVSGLETRTAIAIGLILTPSSTALVLRVLADRSELESIHGRMSLSILLLQDIAIVPMVLLISGMGKESSAPGILLSLGRSVLYISIFFTALLLFNRYVLRRLLDVSAGSRNSELLFLLAIVIAIGSAWAAHQLGVSPSLGAFVAGMLLAESPFTTQIRADVGALRTLFMTLFFTSIGMLANTSWIAANWIVILAVLVAIVFGKIFIVWISGLLLTRSRKHPLAAGISVAQIGEFSFLLTAIALGNGLINEHLYQLIISTTIFSLLLAPLLISKAVIISNLTDKVFHRSIQALSDTGDIGTNRIFNHVIIIGFGPSGRGAWQTIEKLKILVVLIEFNHRTAAEVKKNGITAIFGDATREQTLTEANVEKSLLVVITIPDPHASLKIIAKVRAMAPQVPIIVRARQHIYAEEFNKAGADVIVDEEEQMGRLLGEEVLKRLNIGNPG
jgi:monovalent cation:H+ antiporter-2, CPA2 family